MLRLLGSVVGLVGLALGLFGCNDVRGPIEGKSNRTPILELSDSNTNKFDLSVFEKNRELWTSQNIQSYRLIIGATGFLTNFPEEVLVEVRNREAKSIKSLSATGRNGTSTYSPYETVDKLFSFVSDQNRRGVKVLTVNYDPDLGYPKRIELDQDGYYGNDDELTLQVRSIEIIK